GGGHNPGRRGTDVGDRVAPPARCVTRRTLAELFDGQRKRPLHIHRRVTVRAHPPTRGQQLPLRLDVGRAVPVRSEPNGSKVSAAAVRPGLLPGEKIAGAPTTQAPRTRACPSSRRRSPRASNAPRVGTTLVPDSGSPTTSPSSNACGI